MIRIIFQVSKQLSTFTRYKQDIEKTLELSTISKTELGENLNKLQRVSFSRHVKLLSKNKYLDFASLRFHFNIGRTFVIQNSI